MQTLVIRTKQYTNNSLNIWAETPQQIKPITADPKNKKIYKQQFKSHAVANFLV